ncbi:hypothetical protein SNE40_015160 [Patella caerulea]
MDYQEVNSLKSPEQQFQSYFDGEDRKENNPEKINGICRETIHQENDLTSTEKVNAICKEAIQQENDIISTEELSTKYDIDSMTPKDRNMHHNGTLEVGVDNPAFSDADIHAKGAIEAIMVKEPIGHDDIDSIGTENKKSPNAICVGPTDIAEGGEVSGVSKIVPSISRGLKITVTVCNCVMASLSIGFMLALGVLFVPIIDEFQSTRAETSLVLSVFTGTLFIGGGLTSPLLNKYNGGYISAVMGLVGTAGCLISSFAPSIPVLTFGTGVCTGTALGIAFIVPYITTGEIFEKHRPSMLTVISICPGIGGVVFPYMTSQLITMYGWRGVYLLYAGVLFNIVPIAYLNVIVKKEVIKTRIGGEKIKWKEILNCSLFRKPRFLVLVFCIFLMNTLFPTVNLFFVDMVRGKGFDIQTGSSILSINGFSNMAGRLLIVFLTPFLKISRMAQWSVYIMIISVTVSMYVFAMSYGALLGAAITFGAFWGMSVVSYPAMILEIAGPNRFAAAMGYCNFLGGCGGLIGGPAAGLVKDITGSYDVVYFATSCFGFVASVLLGSMYLKTKCRKRIEESEEEKTSTQKVEGETILNNAVTIRL